MQVLRGSLMRTPLRVAQLVAPEAHPFTASWHLLAVPLQLCTEQLQSLHVALQSQPL